MGFVLPLFKISVFTNFVVWTIWKCKFIVFRKSHCTHFFFLMNSLYSFHYTINVVKIMALTFFLVLRNSLLFSKALISLPCLCGKTICLSFLLVLMTHESWPSSSLHHRTVNASNGSIIAVFTATLSSWFGVNTATISCTLSFDQFNHIFFF